MRCGEGGRGAPRARVVGAVAAVAIVACASTTLAQARAPCVRSDEDRAFALFAQSRTHYEQGRFEDAIDRLERAYTVCPIPVLLYNLARSHEANGDLASAIDIYRRFLRADPEARDRAGIERRIQTLRHQLQARRRGRASPSALPWIVVGAGALGVGTGAVLGALADARQTQARQEPVHLRKAQLASEASDLALGANVAFVAGAIVALAGAIWGVLNLRAVRHERSAGELALEVGPAQARVTWTRRW